MAYFRCGQGSGGGGGGTSLTIDISTSSATLYGLPITITKSGSVVGMTVFDNTGHAEYIVDEAGTYTVSVTLSGVTFSENVVVVDTFEVNLEAIPDGSTATPVDDVQIWLHCASIWDKNYTTVSQVLADQTTLLALIEDSNAVDYMVRSTGFASTICADSTAMTYIGSNDNAADELLDDGSAGGWLETIAASTNMELVLNVKVPTMTGATTPSGETNKYQVFDGNDESSGSGTEFYYHFTEEVCVRCFDERTTSSTVNSTLQYSDDGTTWYSIGSEHSVPANVMTRFCEVNNNKHYYYRLLNSANVSVKTIQFYGRA